MTGNDALGGRVAALDALRGTAALLVLASHADMLDGAMPTRIELSVTGFLLHLFAVGVWLFFALSGFLVGGPWIRALVRGTPLPESGRYALRRSARIFPAYWVALVALFAVGAPRVAVWQVPVHALLLHSLVPGEADTVYFVAWTLGLEAVFYAVLPLVSSAIRRVHPAQIPARTIGLALVVGSIVTALAVVPLDHLVASASTRSPLVVVGVVAEGLVMFVPGLLVALAEEAARSGMPWRPYQRVFDHPVATLSIAAIAAVAGRTVWLVAEPTIALRALVLYAIFSGLVLAVIVHRVPGGPITRALAWTGSVSYGIYLWHWVIIQAMLNHPRLIPLAHHSVESYLVHLAVLLVLTLLVATASWKLLEQPIMRYVAAWPPRHRAVIPTLSTAEG